jgi:hypothetical protein
MLLRVLMDFFTYPPLFFAPNDCFVFGVSFRLRYAHTKATLMRLYGCCARALEAAASSPNARDHELNAWSLGPPGDKTLVQLERVKEAAAELAGERYEYGETGVY